MKRLYCQFAMSFCFGDEFAEINAQNVEGRCDHLNTDRYHLCQWRIYICDGFRAPAAVSPGCLATVVKSHRTWIPTLRFHPPLNILQMAALRAAI